MEFEHFYRAEYTRIYKAVCLATGSRAGAADATQEAFERAFARWRRLRGESWVSGWVMTTALNLCRRQSREVPTEATVLHQNGAHSPSPSLDHAYLIEGLRALPFRQRQALVLYCVGDLPIPAIAQLMKVSEGTVKAHLAQGRKALRAVLEVVDA